MKRTDIIQSLINKTSAENYLEIGVSAGENFRDIKCKNKVGVDPELSTPATIHTDSDSFFKTNKRTTIAIIGAGYADGIPRKLSNKGKVFFKKDKFNIIGRVSMDSFTIDISKILKFMDAA